jgi:hypothetical protein
MARRWAAHLMSHRLNPLGIEGTGGKTEIGQLDVSGIVDQEVLVMSAIAASSSISHVPLA